MVIADAKNVSTSKDRDIHEVLDSDKQESIGLPANPFELMDRLKKSEAMENATIPSDAIDEALKIFNDQGQDIVPSR